MFHCINITHGHLSHFSFTVIMNSAAVNVCVDMFSFLVGIYLRVKLLCHVLPLCLTSEELSNCFPKQLHHLTFLPVTCQGSILHILVNTFICFFNFSHLSECEVVSQDFDLYFSNANDVDIFSCF